MSYRDTATAVARRAPGNFIGVALYVPTGGQPARWGGGVFGSLNELKGWYEEIAGAPTLYYYVAAFDKTQSASPVGETTAPPKPGDPAYEAFWLLQQRGYRWQPGSFGAALEKGPRVGADVSAQSYREPTWYPIALIGGMIGVAWFATSRATAKIKRQRIASDRK